MSRIINKSQKLANVFYDIRGPVLDMAQRLEREGREIIKLNIGNLAAFGFEPPGEVVAEMIRSLPEAAGYTDSKGMTGPREAVVQYAEAKGISGASFDDVYLGNGASELIVMSLNALLDAGDEVLVPAPDYPLWTGAVSLSGGRPVHYVCDETNEWLPDLDDIRLKVSPRTRGIVIINPNNPTGALYAESHLKALVEIAREHGLIVFADEIYDKTLYDGNTHTSIASLADDVLFITFNGLSKNYRACGYRAGWMIVSGDKSRAGDYVEGLNMLASMRLCSNTPGQLAITSALDGRHGIEDLVAPGGRLFEQRELAYEMLTAIPGVSVVKPKAALYMFPKLDPDVYPIDEATLADPASNLHVQKVLEHAKSENADVVAICAKLEAELVALDEAERSEYLKDLGLESSGVDKMIKAAFHMLGLMSFLTAGEKEVRAWTIPIGTKAPQAAGEIHTDIERGFIRAEIVSYNDLVACGSRKAASEKGLARLEGKEYVMQDGDVVDFRFNV